MLGGFKCVCEWIGSLGMFFFKASISAVHEVLIWIYFILYKHIIDTLEISVQHRHSLVLWWWWWQYAVEVARIWLAVAGGVVLAVKIGGFILVGERGKNGEQNVKNEKKNTFIH
uniref:(northern house mosquito) hypothetical protein n=1 Tax=Culex pipiens TaxID=7175 RepID=A0A8D7ZT20_CULPI